MTSSNMLPKGKTPSTPAVKMNPFSLRSPTEPGSATSTPTKHTSKVTETNSQESGKDETVMENTEPHNDKRNKTAAPSKVSVSSFSSSTEALRSHYPLPFSLSSAGDNLVPTSHSTCYRHLLSETLLMAHQDNSITLQDLETIFTRSMESAEELDMELRVLTGSKEEGGKEPELPLECRYSIMGIVSLTGSSVLRGVKRRRVGLGRVDSWEDTETNVIVKLGDRKRVGGEVKRWRRLAGALAQRCKILPSQQRHHIIEPHLASEDTRCVEIRIGGEDIWRGVIGATVMVLPRVVSLEELIALTCQQRSLPGFTAQQAVTWKAIQVLLPLLQMIPSLAKLHRAGFLHMDIKSGNILVTSVTWSSSSGSWKSGQCAKVILADLETIIDSTDETLPGFTKALASPELNWLGVLGAYSHELKDSRCPAEWSKDRFNRLKSHSETYCSYRPTKRDDWWAFGMTLVNALDLIAASAKQDHPSRPCLTESFTVNPDDVFQKLAECQREGDNLERLIFRADENAQSLIRGSYNDMLKAFPLELGNVVGDFLRSVLIDAAKFDMKTVSIAARELNTFVVNQAHVWDAQNAVVEEQRREAVAKARRNEPNEYGP